MFILKLVDQVALFHHGTAVTPPIKGFRNNSIVIGRLSYNNQTLTIGGVTCVIEGELVEGGDGKVMYVGGSKKCIVV